MRNCQLRKSHQHEELKLRFKPAPFLCPELFFSVLLTFLQPWSSLPWTCVPLLALSATVLFSSTVWWCPQQLYLGFKLSLFRDCGVNMCAGVGWLQCTIAFPPPSVLNIFSIGWAPEKVKPIFCSPLENRFFPPCIGTGSWVQGLGKD